MATRFYLPASGSAPLGSLAADSNWERTDGLTRLPCGTTKSNTSLTEVSAVWPVTTTVQWVWRQFQSKPMTAAYNWTTGDAVSMVIKVAESAAQVDSHLAYSIRVVSGDGATVRGTIGLYHAASSEYPTSYAAIATRIHDARTDGASNFSSQVGDRIIIEIGHHGVTPSAATVYHVFGDPSATADYALTAGLTTDLCPWVELSKTVDFDTRSHKPAYTKGLTSGSSHVPAFTPGLTGLAQPHFRIRTDDSQTLNANAGWKADLDTSATMDAGKPFRVRFEVEGNGGSYTDTFKLQYRKNAGSWADLDVTGGATTPGIIIIQSDQFVENDATTNLLSGSSQTFEAGEGKETLTTNSHTLNEEHTEFEWGLMLMGLYDNRARNVTGDTYELRVVATSAGVFTGTYVNPTITVNMPAGYIGGTSPETPSRTLHVDSNKNLYYITEPAESGGLFCLIKSTDGGNSWTVMDAAGSPTESDLESVDATYDSTNHCLHIIHKGSGTSDVMYHRYHTSDHPTTPDDFNIIDEVIAASIGQSDQSCAIQHRSDNTVVAFYRKTNGTAENYMYKIRSSGGTWGSELTLDAEASQVFGHACVVKGASDKIHIFYNNWTAGIGYHRSLSSADSLSARESIGSTLGTGSSSEKNMGQPVYWDSSGNEKIMVIFRNDSTGRINSVVVTNDGTPETARVVSDATVEISEAGSKQPLASLGQDNLDTYCLMVYTSDFDLYRDKATNDGGWGTDVSELTNVEIDFIQALVFTHSEANGGAKVLGYFIEDSTTLVDGFTGGGWYKQYQIAAGGTNTSSNKPTYTKGSQDTTSNKPSYTRGSAESSQNKAAYTTGVGILVGNKPAFTKGQTSGLSNKAAYVKGSTIIAGNKPAHTAGSDTGSSNKPSYIRGSQTSTSNKPSFTKGQDNTTDNISAYTKGADTASTNKPGYTEGLVGETNIDSNKAAYILGAGYPLVPDSTISQDGLWKRENESTADLHLSINEQPGYSDANYVYRTTGEVNNYFEVGLSNPQGVPGDGDVKIWWRGSDLQATGGCEVTIELREGATVRASTSQVLPSNYSTYTYTLSAGEKASITDWTNLRVRVTISAV